MRKKLEEWSVVYSAVGIPLLTRLTKTITNRMEDGIVSRAVFRIGSGKIEGVNSFIKALRRSAFGYQDFDYFAYLIWEQTHKNYLNDKPSSDCLWRSYSRKKQCNLKKLKQTVFELPVDCNKVR